MHGFLSQKKQLEDSLSSNIINLNRINAFMNADMTPDSTYTLNKFSEQQIQFKLRNDSVSNFESRIKIQGEAIKKVIYSIDSLSKLR